LLQPQVLQYTIELNKGRKLLNNMNLFKKSSLWKLIVAIFTLSLYAHIAEAKGIASIFTIIAVVALVFLAVVIVTGFGIGAGGFLSGFVETTVGGVVVHGAAWYGIATGAILAASIVGMTVGQVQCFMGQDNIWFSGCSEGVTTPAGWTGTPGSPVLSYASFTATCNSVSLTYDISNANQYGIYRAGNLITSGNAQGLSKILYTDSNLTKHTYYQYVLVMTNNQGEQFQYPAINAYTRCLPQCSFTTDKSEIIAPGQATLSWNCQDADSCAIALGVGSVNPQTGQTKVSPTASTTYILTCSNIDGEASFSTNINVKIPKLEEVIP
jgi:hypothetical protein